MKIISLTHEQVTLVDDEDYEMSNRWKWFAIKNKNGDFYAVRHIKTEKGWELLRMARKIMNAPKGQYVDHRNHQTLDNQKHNLRICTQSENMRNRKKENGCSSKYKGVHWSKARKKWQVFIMINRKNKHLGYFTNEEDAARTYNQAALKYFEEFALLNIINL